MKTKLTLSIDKTAVKKARLISRSRKQSISALFEDFIEHLYEINNPTDKKPPAIVLSKGILKWKYPDHINYKELQKTKDEKTGR